MHGNMIKVEKTCFFHDYLMKIFKKIEKNKTILKIF